MKNILFAISIITIAAIPWTFAGKADSAAPKAPVPAAVSNKTAATPSAALGKLVVGNPSPSLGDTVVVNYTGKISDIASSTFAGKPVQFFDYGTGSRALLPIAPTARTGAHTLFLKFRSGSIATRTITVKTKKFPLIDLGVPDKLDQTPDQAVAGLAKTNASLSTIWQATSSAPYFKAGFTMPLKSFKRYGAPFGELRKTGASQVRHLGTDFTADIGMPVYAINDGVVSKAYMDASYGNTVILDHGAGIFSLYLHLDAMNVKQGERIARGQKIGEVGETGYAFGPHLHFSVKIDGVSVDPVRFVQGFK